MENLDYPLPPHHYLQFTAPDVMGPPDIRRLAAKNPEFYALGGVESFADFAEKITPNYLADKRPLLR